MLEEIKNSYLFTHMIEEEIQKFLTCSTAKIKVYQKDELIFKQLDEPRKLYVLLNGSVAVCKDSITGKRSMITAINRQGDLFGEVYLFLYRKAYDYDAIATEKTKVLEIPKDFFYHTCPQNCHFHERLIRNMLNILAEKAFFLTHKVQLMSLSSLRQKILKVLLDHYETTPQLAFKMKREEFADFLGVARPSLSRELMKMQEEDLIRIDGRKLKLGNLEKIQNYI